MPLFARPNSDVNAGVWLNELGSSVNLYQSIDETSVSTADYATVLSLPLAGDPDLPYTFGLSSVADPITHTGHLFDIWIFAAYTSGGARNGTIELLEGTTVRASLTFSVDNSGVQQKTLTLTTGEAAAITDYSNLRGRITLLHTGTTDWALTLYMAQFQVPQVFAHLDASGGGLLNAAAASGNYLEVSGAGLIRKAGTEGAGSIVIAAGSGLQVHA